WCVFELPARSVVLRDATTSNDDVPGPESVAPTIARTRMTPPTDAMMTSSRSNAAASRSLRLETFERRSRARVPALRLGELTSCSFHALDPKPPLLVPVGIVEEHGAHLPLDADSIQA